MSEENDVSAQDLDDSLESLSETVGNVVRERAETERILAKQAEELMELRRHQAEDQAAIRGAAELISKTGSMKTRDVWWHETHAAAIQRAREQA